MKAITVKQPWAYLICAGIKNIENRTWNTKYRGRVYIHAAAKSWRWHKVCEYLVTEVSESVACKLNIMLPVVSLMIGRCDEREERY